MHFSIDRTVHTTAFDKPVVDHWLERKITQTAAGSTEKDRSDDRPLQRRARYRLSYIPLPTRSNDSDHTTNVVVNITELSSFVGDICCLFALGVLGWVLLLLLFFFVFFCGVFCCCCFF